VHFISGRPATSTKAAPAAPALRSRWQRLAAAAALAACASLAAALMATAPGMLSWMEMWREFLRRIGQL